MEKIDKKKLLIIIPATVLLLIVIILIGYFIRFPSFLFPKASTYDITGKWQININITSPSSESSQGLATLAQSATGSFSGITSEMDGSNSQSISGTVTGNQMVTNPIAFSGSTLGITYEGTYKLTGTISEGSTSISGNVSGTLTKPNNSPISGTFTATRTEGPPPTTPPTITPTPTTAPTATPTSTSSVTPIPSGATPVATIAYRTPIPGYTNPPIPVSGVDLPTILGVGGGIIFLLLTALLIL